MKMKASLICVLALSLTPATYVCAGGGGYWRPSRHYSTTPSPSYNLVKRAQEALLEHGFDPKGIDGIMGPNTKSAILAFQRSSGIDATGELDSQTKRKLLK